MEGVQGPGNAIGDLGLAGFEVFDACLGRGERRFHRIALKFNRLQARFQGAASVLVNVSANVSANVSGWARMFGARRRFGRFADVLLALTPSHGSCLHETIRLAETVKRWRAGLNLKHCCFHEEMTRLCDLALFSRYLVVVH